MELPSQDNLLAADVIAFKTPIGVKRDRFSSSDSTRNATIVE